MSISKLHTIFCTAAMCVALTSCDGILGDIYDEAPSDTAFEVGFHPQQQSGRYLLMLDARNYETWHYIDLKRQTITSMPVPRTLTGEWDGKSGFTYNLVEGSKYTPYDALQTDPQPEPDAWDFAMHHFDVKTNGGAVAVTDCTSIDQLPALADLRLDFVPDRWNTTQVITDLSEMMGFRIGFQNSMVNEVISDWVKMDFSTPPPTYSPTGLVYVMRLADGSCAAMKMSNYMSDKGTKGFLTIDILYPYK